MLSRASKGASKGASERASNNNDNDNGSDNDNDNDNLRPCGLFHHRCDETPCQTSCASGGASCRLRMLEICRARWRVAAVKVSVVIRLVWVARESDVKESEWEEGVGESRRKCLTHEVDCGTTRSFLKECLDAFIQDCWQAFADKSVHEQSSDADVNVIFCQFGNRTPSARPSAMPINPITCQPSQSGHLQATCMSTSASKSYPRCLCLSSIECSSSACCVATCVLPIG